MNGKPSANHFTLKVGTAVTGFYDAASGRSRTCSFSRAARGAWRKRSGRRKELRRRRARVTASRERARLVKMMATDAEEISFPTSPCPVPDNSSSSTLTIKITRKNQDRHWKLRFIYLQCCEYRHTTQSPSPPP